MEFKIGDKVKYIGGYSDILTENKIYFIVDIAPSGNNIIVSEKFNGDPIKNMIGFIIAFRKIKFELVEENNEKGNVQWMI